MFLPKMADRNTKRQIIGKWPLAATNGQQALKFSI